MRTITEQIYAQKVLQTQNNTLQSRVNKAHEDSDKIQANSKTKHNTNHHK